MRFQIFVLSVLFAWIAMFFQAGAAADGSIVIGVTLPRTGPLEDYGISAYYGIVACAQKINAAGGINGRPLQLEWRDNASDPNTAAETIRDLVVNYQVAAIIGPLCSNAAIHVKPLARELGVVLISPMSTMNAISEQDPWVFRTSSNSFAQVNALLRFETERRGYTKGAVLYDSRQKFSQEMSSAFLSAMPTKGVASMGRYDIVADSGEIDFHTPLQTIAASGTDFIFAPVYVHEATELIQAAKEMGITASFCAPSTWDNELLYFGSGTRLGGSTFCSALFEREYNRYSREFFAAMGEMGMDEPDTVASDAYDSLFLLAKALEKRTDPEGIRQELLHMEDVSIPSGRFSFTAEGNSFRAVVVRFAERHGDRMIPIFAEKYDVPRKRRGKK